MTSSPRADVDSDVHTRIRQQEVVAELGQQALEIDDLDQLMHDAAVAVAETLNNEYAKILELLPGGDEVFLREGVGWHDGLVGNATVPTDLDSQAGYTLLSEEPIIVDNLRTEKRFSGPDLLREHDVISGISVIIGSIEEPWGVLGTHTTKKREFTEHDATFVKNVANVLAAAIDRAKKEQQLHEQQIQLDLATEAASIGLWTWDIQEDVVTADEYLAESYGVDSETAAAGAPMEDFYEPIHEDDTVRTRKQLTRAVEETGELKVEYRVRDAAGDVKWVEARGETEYDDDGEPVQLNGAITDITERKRHERELKRALDLLEKTEHIADVGGWEIDPDTQDVFWSDNLFELLGVTSDEEPPLDEALNQYHEEDRPIVTDAVEEALDSGDPFDVEARIRTADGEVRWLRLQGVPEIVDEKVVSLRGAAQDITERKERERELETLFEVLPVGVVVADEDGRILQANETAHAIWGGDVFNVHSVEEYKRYPVQWADSGETVPPEEMTLARVLDGEEVTEPEIFEIEAADGERRIVRTEGMPIRDARGKVTRGVVTLTDITERKEAQRQLAESERLYRTLAEHFPNGVVGVYDSDLRYSLAAGELIGDPAPSTEEAEGSRMRDIYPDEVVEDLEPLFRAAIEDGEIGSTRTTVVGRRWQVWATPLQDADGEIFAGLSFAQDITEQIKREEKLTELVEKLEESNKRLEQFAYAASHDLQEPLRMVSSYLRLLESRYSDDLDNEAEEFLEFAVNGADRMREMIDGLLEYSRVDTQGNPLEPVDLDRLVAEVQEDLQMQLAESGAQITTEDLPHVEGDDSQAPDIPKSLQ
ncbi:PAS domain S-box protein [Natrinema zhouii]|uniref:histidine kinase n=1 Tax=Natrinema zhouii TaxID=1710539 RepID=A0A7D6CPJ6_9EURY|nr:PAS domain S-box protein [Natrinema zhouii]